MHDAVISAILTKSDLHETSEWSRYAQRPLSASRGKKSGL